MYGASGVDAFNQGSVLNLSSLKVFGGETQSFSGHASGSELVTIHASNGGRINVWLEDASIVGGQGNERLRFLYQGSIDGQGHIDLDSLKTASRVELEVDASEVTLPALVTATTSHFDIDGEGEIKTGELLQHDIQRGIDLEAALR